MSSQAINSGLANPPLQTPITSPASNFVGQPYSQRDRPEQFGLMPAPQWSAYFNEVYQRLILAPVSATIEDAHANRANYAAASYPGILYYETDRKVFYLSVAGAWIYAGGQSAATQSALPADLGSDDAGFLCAVTDYAHLLQWSGTGWGWAPGDSGSGDMVFKEFDPSPTTGWQLYDGTTGVTALQSDGTLTAPFTIPNLVSVAAYLKAGSPNSGPNAAIAPTFAGGSDTTSSVSAGTLGSVNITTTPGLSPVLTNPNVLPVHSHTVTPTGTVSNTGEPRNIVRRPWLRL